MICKVFLIFKRKCQAETGHAGSKEWTASRRSDAWLKLSGITIGGF